MTVTAYRAGPALASTGLLPSCTVLCTEECSICGLPYILVLADAHQHPDESDLRAHVDRLQQAITQSHTDGHTSTRLCCDGVQVSSR